ncbi:MAG: DUF59 domain-containing protein [Proteobacteria bacterium]|nr:DUF59 domain-containing protein [Pseudomonadota bacterium]
MNFNLSEMDIREAIGHVKHPAIDHSLVDLGIVKDVTIAAQKIMLTFAFPFPNIPIGAQLIDSVRLPLENVGAEVEVQTTVMKPAEVQKFLAMEQDGWKGGV